MKHLITFALVAVLGACDGAPSPTGDEFTPVVEAGQDEEPTTAPENNNTVDGVVTTDKPIAEPEAPAIDPIPTEPPTVGNPCDALVDDGLKPGEWDSAGSEPGPDPFDGLGILTLELQNMGSTCLVIIDGNGASWGGEVEAVSLPLTAEYGIAFYEADIVDEGFLVQRTYYNGELQGLESWYKKR